MFVIFGASTDLGSMQETSRFIVPLLRWLDPQISVPAIEQFQFLIRKVAHVTEYAVLALLLFRAIRRSVRGGTFPRYAAIVCVAAGLFAMTDEYHQSFVPSRTATPRDVMIDCCGVLVGLLIYWRAGRARRNAGGAAKVL